METITKPATQKTPVERKAELSALLSASPSASNASSASIPADVLAVIGHMAGVPVMLGDVKIADVPIAVDWKVVQTSKGKTLYTALDTFGLRPIGNIAGREVGIKVSLVVR